MFPNKARLLGATALVAAGLLALAVPASAQVSAQFVNAQTGTTYTVLQSDCSKLVTFSNGSSVAVTLPQAGTSGKFFAGCFVDFENKGAGTVTITPTTSTINGATTLVLSTNKGARIVSDSTNYQVQLGAGASAGTAICAGSIATPQCNGLVGKVQILTLALVIRDSTSLVFTNTLSTTSSPLVCQIGTFTGTLGSGGTPAVTQCTPGTGIITAVVTNVGTSTMNGGMVLSFQLGN